MTDVESVGSGARNTSRVSGAMVYTEAFFAGVKASHLDTEVLDGLVVAVHFFGTR